MKKTKMYRYWGKNGTLTSRVLLQDPTRIEMFFLEAEPGKILTDGYTKTHSIFINPEDIDEWIEIDLEEGQN